MHGLYECWYSYPMNDETTKHSIWYRFSYKHGKWHGLREDFNDNETISSISIFIDGK